MKPNKNDLVKIFLKNGLQVEGRVQSWDKQIILSSEDSDNYLVITKTKYVLMYKVVKENKLNNFYSPEIREKNDFYQEEVESNFEQEDFQASSELQENLNSQDLKIKTLAELRKAQIEEEKKAIAKRMKEHHIGQLRKVEYIAHDQIPGFYKK